MVGHGQHFWGEDPWGRLGTPGDAKYLITGGRGERAPDMVPLGLAVGEADGDAVDDGNGPQALHYIQWGIVPVAVSLLAAGRCGHA